jgi:hypothetical protein
MNVIHITHHGKVIDEIEIKTFDELTIGEWERIAPDIQPGETKDQLLTRVFGIDPEQARLITPQQADDLMRFRATWITEHNRTFQMVQAIGKAFEDRAKNTVDELRKVWSEFKPSIATVSVHGKTYAVPQDIGSTLFAQWVNFAMAINDKAIPPDPEVEGDTGREGSTTTQFYAQVLACMLTDIDHPDEWMDNGTKEDEKRFEELFKTRTAAMYGAKMGEAIEVCSLLMMQRSAMGEQVRAGLPSTPGVASAQVAAGLDYFTERWGMYSQVAEPSFHYEQLRRMHGDKGMVANFTTLQVLQFMAYLIERGRFEAGTQRALAPAVS